MVFSSVIFLFLFLPIVLGCYYLLPGREAKNLWLVAASLLFYAFSGLWYVLLLLFSVFCNYLAGLFVSGRKSVLYAAVAVNLGILGIFKYLTFLVQTVDPALFCWRNGCILWEGASRTPPLRIDREHGVGGTIWASSPAERLRFLCRARCPHRAAR